MNGFLTCISITENISVWQTFFCEHKGPSAKNPSRASAAEQSTVLGLFRTFSAQLFV
jgi:hypothetical protein